MNCLRNLSIGVTIRSMRGLEGAGLSQLAIADDWLCYRWVRRYLNQLINQMNKGKNSLWESTFIQNALDDLPGIRQGLCRFQQDVLLFQVMFEAIDENDFATSPTLRVSILPSWLVQRHG